MDEQFKFRLRKAMEEKGITASELSRETGIGKSDISYYLKGRYVPKQDKCYELARALGIDPGWLMTGFEPNEKPHHVDYGKHGLSDEDNAILEALHQNPELGLLFDRTKHMSKDDMNFMLRVADGIKRERNGE